VANPASSTGSRRFAVALSFPGERREFVQQVAQQVAATYGVERVLYDRFHEAEFARMDLDVYLPGLYRTESELVVVFLCPEYLGKKWCGLECRHIRQLLGTPEAERIMLVSFEPPGDLAPLGIVSGDGYLNVAGRSPGDIAEQIRKRHQLRSVARRGQRLAVDVKRVPEKGSWSRYEKPALMTLGASARSEDDGSTRLELEIGFPTHRVRIGLLDQRHISIGCTAAQLRITNHTGSFTAWHDSVEGRATCISASVLEWLVLNQGSVSGARILTGNRTLWAAFPCQGAVDLKTSATPVDRRVFDDEERPLGIRGSLALLAKLIATGASLPAAESLEETIRVSAPTLPAGN
jgi:hypothetical protein